MSVNSAAVADPGLLTQMASRLGSSCTVLAIDAKRRLFGDSWEVMVQAGRRGSGKDVEAWAREAEHRGVGEILLTSLDRDGTGLGYDLQLLQRVRAAVSVPIVASGGASAAADLAGGLAAGADAVLAASIFHTGGGTVAQVKGELRSLGANVRP